MALALPKTERGRARRLIGPILAAASVALLYIWDDVIFAAPIVAVTGLAGPWIAFAAFSIAYGIGSFGIALLGVRAYDRSATGRESRLADWLARQGGGRRTVWGKRLLDSGKVLGFIASSFALGGIITTWLIRYSGRRERIELIAALSCAIFGITFTAMYTGLAQAVFSI